MLDVEYRKSKTAPKIMVSNEEQLKKIIFSTVAEISTLVGSTLGPSGKTVLIERGYTGLPNQTTKDGVTVIRSMAYYDPLKQVILETFRDAAVKTVELAGDGPQPLFSKILTPNGFVTMADIKVGMKICGTDGSLQKVTGVYPKGQKEIIKIAFEGGKEVLCCEDHLWSIITSQGKSLTLTTKQMLSDFVSIKNGYKFHKYYIPRTVPEFAGNEFTIDPYLLGVLLGDGSLRDSGSIEISLGKNKQHIINKLVLPKGIQAVVSYVDHKNYFRIKLTGTTANGKHMRDLLEDLNLKNVNSHTKFIPHKYLFSNLKARQALLQGLTDTDGYVNDRGLIEFSTVSDKLAEDFITLMRSLGKTIHYRLHNRDNDKDAYSKNPIHRINELSGNKYGDKIINIEKTGQFTEMQCIKVSNSNSLYITDDFVVTHNTSTSSILAHALLREMLNYLNVNKKQSPQRVMREVQNYSKEVMIPFIKSKIVKITPENEKDLLFAVANISTNGDKVLAKAVLDCFDLVGDGGHITIAEDYSGNGFEVSKISGLPLTRGWEDSLNVFFNEFINDNANNRIILDNCKFILIDAKINDLNAITPLLALLEQEALKSAENANYVLVANGFSRECLVQLARLWQMPNGALKVLPLVTPIDMYPNAQHEQLIDIAAYVGARVFNPLSYPANKGLPRDLGVKVISFECNKYRSVIHGSGNTDTVLKRASELESQLNSGVSKLMKNVLQERIGKLTGGIAKLTIKNLSDSAIMEIKDRADDAICAIRGALKYGVLPGGCRILMDLRVLSASSEDEIIQKVVGRALQEPFECLLKNCGMNNDEIIEIGNRLIDDDSLVYDCMADTFGSAFDLKLFDSSPAVIEALNSAVSIASNLATIGGMVVFERDEAADQRMLDLKASTYESAQK